MSMVVRGAVPLAIAALAVACGNPSAPSSNAASIAGTVRVAATARAATNAASPSLTTTVKITVKGTSLGTTTNSSGQFTLNGIPTGSVTLVFEGSGVNAQLPLGTLQPGDRVTITVTVSGSDARLDDREDDHDDDEDDDDDGGREVEGAIAGLNGTCPNRSFTIGAMTVNTNSGTKYEDVTCAGLANGMKVEAKGSLAGSVLTATKIERD
jgi:uncharacterized protein DUF5666/carboxypeptidase-like protein